jgi:hypothetical protein
MKLRKGDVTNMEFSCAKLSVFKLFWNIHAQM